MAQKKIPTIYKPIVGFYIGGKWIDPSTTVVAGHPYLKGRTKLFTQWHPTYGELEPAPEPAPEPIPTPDPEPTPEPEATD